MRFFIIFIIMLLSFVVIPTNACTNIKLNYQNQYVIGHNFDWPVKYSFIVINPAHSKHQSINFMNLKNNQTPLQWVSKYGSVTIDFVDKNNKLDTNSVLSGINQYGLSASILWLDDTKYPEASKKPVIGTSTWVQYILDNAKTVAEAIEVSKKVDVQPTNYQGHPVLVHLVVHDALGHSAVMEYTNGNLKIYQGKALSVPVLTNHLYPDSIQSLQKYKNFGSDVSLPGGHYSATRFVLASYFLKKLPPITSNQQAIANTFVALGYLSQPPGSSWLTGWSVVYDLENKTLYYRDVDNQQIRFIHLKDFNFASKQPVKILLMNNHFNGDVKNDFQVMKK